MTLDRAHNYRVILASFICAFMLAAMPLPDWAQYWRPHWVALVLVYWCIALPRRVGIATAWVLGLLLDVLTGAVLGQNALALSLVAFLAVSLHQQIRVFPLGQQALVVGLVLLPLPLITAGVTALVSPAGFEPRYLNGLVTSMFLWPWVFVLLRDLRRRHHVA